MQIYQQELSAESNQIKPDFLLFRMMQVTKISYPLLVTKSTLLQVMSNATLPVMALQQG